jgi:DNA-binding transcriptional LysR family regulator
MELTSNEAVKQALLAGLGFSIMPVIGIRNELLNNELKIYPVNGLPIKTNWSLIWLKEKKHSPVSESFLAHLREEKMNIANKIFGWQEKYH